jgi:transposase, IS30 family
VEKKQREFNNLTQQIKKNICRMRGLKYKRISLEERIKISTLLEEKRSKSYISKFLGRSRSTISREINFWVVNSGDKYDFKLAHWYSQETNLSKRKTTKIEINDKLRLLIYRGLIKGLSPEQISGRLRLENSQDTSMQISHESIYKHIYEHPQGRLNRKLIGLLLRKKSRRIMHKKGSRRLIIKDKISIDNRPKEVENREEVGHWEGDLIVGLNNKSYIGSLVERKTRYLILVKFQDKKSETVVEGFYKNLRIINTNLKKTMTYDNGTELAQHKKFSNKTGMTVYFAHPYSSWERGSNENTNGIVRRDYPKKTDFNKISQQELEELQEKLNNKPRKVLGYYTPKEMLEKELETIKLKKNDNDDNNMLITGDKSFSDLFSLLTSKIKKKL